MKRHSRIYSWKSRLAIGKRGEAWFAKHYGATVTPPECMEYDLVLPDGRTVELKTDTYDHTKTEYYFMERLCGEKAGGPWRAEQDDIDVFAYLFMNPTPLCFVWSDVLGLVAQLDAWVDTNNPWQHTVRSQGWTAWGYRVPRGRLVESTQPEVIAYD